ncbi:hypothetical protein OH76DRAFT_1421504 [Lentinus brumalis]|uniref:Uncharacterized protein n=1 Tax=Lentinus brumalis TaxID=2498619 RepID=A0A371CV79_9APHY|nr:hypothetical protein OH76DRAFT_1421504 [Polyporus brumalis]
MSAINEAHAPSQPANLPNSPRPRRATTQSGGKVEAASAYKDQRNPGGITPYETRPKKWQDEEERYSLYYYPLPRPRNLTDNALGGTKNLAARTITTYDDDGLGSAPTASPAKPLQPSRASNMSHRAALNETRIVSPGLWTPSQGTILVPATPPPPPRDDTQTTPQNAPPVANAALTPMVIDDTLDLQAMAPLLGAAQLYDQATPGAQDPGQQSYDAENIAAVMRHIAASPPSNPAAQHAGYLQWQAAVPLHVRAFHGLGPQQPQPPPMATTAPAPLNEHNLNRGAAGSGNAGVPIWAEYASNGVPPPAISSTTGVPQAATPTHATLANAHPLSSSPLSFDWNSPTPRGPRASNNAATIAGARGGGLPASPTLALADARRSARASTVHATDESSNPTNAATTLRPRDATSDVAHDDQNGAQAQAPGEREATTQRRTEDAATQERTREAAEDPGPTGVNANANAIATTNAGAGVSTATGSRENTDARTAASTSASVDAMTAAHTATTVDASNAASMAATTGAGISTGEGSSTVHNPHGERLCFPTSLDDHPTARKRSWPGSPNQEDIRRSMRRPRRLDPTQQLAPDAPPSAPSDGSNPWRSSRREAGLGREFYGCDEGFFFAPVASSTPPPRFVPDIDNRTPLGHSALHSTRRLRSEANSGARGCPDANGRAPVGNTTSEPAAAMAPARPQPMIVDSAPDEQPSPSPTAPKQNKGKQRAAARDHEAEENDEGHPEPEENGWDEADLLEARRRSLRQELPHGSHSLTAEAGPSRHAERWTRHNSRRTTERGGRGELTSQPPQSTHQQDYYRARSAFLPLRNTRAAEYLADAARRERSRTPPLTQRPPPLRTSQSRTYEMLSPEAPSNRGPQILPTRQEDDAWMESVDDRRLETGSCDEAEEEPALIDESWNEDGEIVPTALRADEHLDDDHPTEPPRAGFPRIHRDDPETATRGMANEWVREIWADPPNTDVLVEVFNYRYTENDAHNRRIADLLRWAFEQMSGETDFDVVPPEPAEGPARKARDRPTTWAIRGLPGRCVASAVERGVWSFRAITFIATPRAVTLPSWLLMLEGFLTDNATKIRDAVLRVLREDTMWEWIAEMVSINPDFAGMHVDEAVERVLASVRIDTFQLSNGNYIANVYVGRSPTRSMREWRRWAAALRARRYPSFTNGAGRVRYIAPCAGCKSVNHLTHLCPYPKTRGWNGPTSGKGVFDEKHWDDEEDERGAGLQRWPHDGQRERRERRDFGLRGSTQRDGRQNETRRNGGQHEPRRNGRQHDNRRDERQHDARRGGPGSGSGSSTGSHRNTHQGSSSRQRGGPSTRGKKGPGRGFGDDRRL